MGFSIQHVLSTKGLANDAMSPLERELLLSHVLDVSRSYLHAHPEHELKKTEYGRYQSMIERSRRGEPIAYILGHKEFWSLNLKVTHDTLVPRPETELLVELALSQLQETGRVADLGTGTGAIALALLSEKPGLTVFASDISEAAIQVAKYNAEKLALHNITFHQGHWCQALPDNVPFDIIISNPPYLSCDDRPLPFEPSLALLSWPDGLRDLYTLIEQAKSYLKIGGVLLLEHGFQQGEKVRSKFKELGYNDVSTYHDLAKRERVTLGTWVG